MLYPAHLRDSLLLIAEAGFYRPVWSAEIVDELRRNLVGQVITEKQFDYLAGQLTDAFADAQIDGYQSLIADLKCDQKDRHVLAAAIRGDVVAIVTFNVDDFPEESTKDYGISVYSPDEFLMSLFAQDKEAVVEIVSEQGKRNSVAPKTLVEVADALAVAGVPRFSAAILELGRNR